MNVPHATMVNFCESGVRVMLLSLLLLSLPDDGNDDDENDLLM